MSAVRAARTDAYPLMLIGTKVASAVSPKYCPRHTSPSVTQLEKPLIHEKPLAPGQHPDQRYMSSGPNRPDHAPRVCVETASTSIPQEPTAGLLRMRSLISGLESPRGSRPVRRRSSPGADRF
ncbi:MAG: hypothetical protein ABGZ17_09680, partial [Planctomycetaceae bacterium]